MGDTPRLVILLPRHIRHIRHTLTSRHVRTSHIHVQIWVVTVQRISQRRQTRSPRINLRSLSNKTEVARLQRRTAVARTDRLKKEARRRRQKKIHRQQKAQARRRQKRVLHRRHKLNHKRVKPPRMGNNRNLKKTRLNGNLVMIPSKQELTNNDTIIYRNLSSSTSARDVIIYVIMTSSAGLT